MTPDLANLSKLLRRVAFFDLTNSSETVQDRSKCNPDESLFTVNLIKTLVSLSAHGNSHSQKGLGPLSGKIAVITPYKAQVQMLKNAIGAWFRTFGGKFTNQEIEVNTVDAFQGREKDIVIFNCVRSNKLTTLQASLGFLTDQRRLNVAITRPRHFLFYVGNSDTLHKCDVWRQMVTGCRQKDK